MHSSRYINPYIAGNAVKDAEMFFGREDVFDFIRRNLVGPHSNNPIVLYGQRRTGKTSVLYQLQRRLGTGYWCVFIDLHGLNLGGMANLMRGIATAISANLRRDHQVTVEVPNRAAFEAEPTSAFGTMFLDQVFAVLGDNQLVLMVDEAVRLDEEVRAGRLEHEIFEYLRHLMQHSQRLNFLFSLGSGIEEMAKDYALLFNGSLYHRISFLKSQAARDLIIRPARDHYQVTDQAVDKILQITSGHPYYTQLVCHCLFNAWVQKPVATIEADNVTDILAEAIELGSANLTYVWQDSTTEEQALMAGLAANANSNETTVTAEEIREAWRRADVDVPSQEITRSLRGLIAREVISGRDTYSFTVDLQRMWIDKHRRINWVKDDLREAIAQWAVSGGTPAVAEDREAEVSGVRPFVFQQKQYRDRKALAGAFVRAWDEAARRYFVVMGTAAAVSSSWRELQEWLEQFRGVEGEDPEALNAMIDDQLLSPSLPPDVKLLILVQWLDPDLPPVYRGQTLDPANLAAVAERAAVDHDPEPWLVRLVADLSAYDLLTRLARMRGGGGLAEADGRWRELDARFGRRAQESTSVLPGEGRQVVMDARNARRQAVLLYLALDPLPHQGKLRQHLDGMVPLLPAPVPWFDRIWADAQDRHDPLDDALLLVLFPLAARESAAADQARVQAEMADRRNQERWAEQEQQRLAGKPSRSQALKYSGIIAAVMLVMFIISVAAAHSTFTVNAIAADIGNGLAGGVVVAVIATTELSLATQLGSDYANYPATRNLGQAFRRAGSHVHGAGRGCLLLLLLPFLLGAVLWAAFVVPAVGYAVIGIVHIRSWLRRRKAWTADHEQERVKVFGSPA